MDTLTGLLSGYGIPVLAAAAIVYLWNAIALGIVFGRLGEPGWAAWIPIANTAVLYRGGGHSALWVLALLVPVLNLVALVVMVLAIHGVNRRLGRGAGATVLAIVLWPIWLGVAAFGRADARGITVRSFARADEFTDSSSVMVGLSSSAPTLAAPAAFSTSFVSRTPIVTTRVADMPPVALAMPTAAGVATGSGSTLVAPPRTEIEVEHDDFDAMPALSAPAYAAAPAVPVAPLAPMGPVGPGGPRSPGGPDDGWEEPAAGSVEEYLSFEALFGFETTTTESVVPPITALATTPAPVRMLPVPVRVPEPVEAEVEAEVDAHAETDLDEIVYDDSAVVTALAPASAHVEDDDDFEATVIAGRRHKPWIIETVSGQRVEVTSTVILLGRNPAPVATLPEAQLVVLSDEEKTVSKTHARAEFIDGMWRITDLNSTNGVYLVTDGEEHELEAGVDAELTEHFILGELPARIYQVA